MIAQSGSGQVATKIEDKGVSLNPREVQEDTKFLSEGVSNDGFGRFKVKKKPCFSIIACLGLVFHMPQCCSNHMSTIGSPIFFLGL